MQLRPLPLVLVTCSLIPLSGCSLFEPLIGEWELTDASGDSVEYGYRDVDFSGSMEFDDELNGTLEIEMSYSDGDESYTDAYEWDLEAENEGGGEYTITMAYTDNEDDEEDMTCEIDGGELTCEFEDADVTLEFEKVK